MVATTSITSMMGWRTLSRKVLRMIAKVCWNILEKRPEERREGGWNGSPWWSGGCRIQPGEPNRVRNEHEKSMVRNFFLPNLEPHPAHSTYFDRFVFVPPRPPGANS